MGNDLILSDASHKHPSVKASAWQATSLGEMLRCMSKAFTRDEGEGSGEPPALPLGAPLPAGARNYVTPEGATALRARLAEAQLSLEQARASHDAVRTQLAQQRLEFFAGRAAAMEEVRPPAAASSDGPVRFGAAVRIRDDDGAERQVQIVGIDEADPARGRISWTSPLARALTGRRVGDEVRVETPRGAAFVEILAVSTTTAPPGSAGAP